MNRYALIAAVAACAGPSTAAVTAEEAAKLKTTLTPFGAERAGNRDNTIPAWSGGYTTVPAGYKSGDPRADPFAAEKPLFSISAKNMDQYGPKLAEGVKAILSSDSSYRIDIYPTHRSAAAPQWVYDNTFLNATRAKLIDDGFGVGGAYGGVPFPIPKDGYEALWNHRLAWQGASLTTPSATWLVQPDGARELASSGNVAFLYPYYDKGGGVATFKGYSALVRYTASAPPAQAGEAILGHEPTSVAHAREVWQYLVGQRRVRRAPSVAYDTPDSITSGMALFDEAFGLSGPSDRHQWKLLGKREMYIPYNDNRAALAKSASLFQRHFLNPDLVRWELHRVWVLEADLLPGKRHVMKKRVFYLDEDTWHIVWQDAYDAQDKLWHSVFVLPYLAPDIPALTTVLLAGVKNQQSGAYVMNFVPNERPDVYRTGVDLSPGLFTPQALANDGAR